MGDLAKVLKRQLALRHAEARGRMLVQREFQQEILRLAGDDVRQLILQRAVATHSLTAVELVQPDALGQLERQAHVLSHHFKQRCQLLFKDAGNVADGVNIVVVAGSVLGDALHQLFVVLNTNADSRDGASILAQVAGFPDNLGVLGDALVGLTVSKQNNARQVR